MRIRSTVAALALVSGTGAVAANGPVLQVTVSRAAAGVAPQSRFTEGAYRATGIEFRELLRDAYDADIRDVMVFRGVGDHEDEAFDVSIVMPGEDADAIRAALQGVAEALIHSEIRVFDEPETVYDISVADPAKLPPPRMVLGQSSRMSNIDRAHFDIECKSCTAEWLASLVDITTPSPKLVLGGLLAGDDDDRFGDERDVGKMRIRWDFECLNCTVESLVTYLRDEKGFTVTPRETTVRYVQVDLP